jgi:HAT1-interacting factor 1
MYKSIICPHKNVWVLINRVAHYGELAPECVHTYYKYGCALLYKAQEEADPLGAVPKKQEESPHGADKDGPVKGAMNAESSTASFASNIEQDVTSNNQESEVDNGQYVASAVFCFLH